MNVPKYKDGPMKPRSVTLPASYRRVLIVRGKGNISSGIRTLVEEFMKDELKEDEAVCEDFIKNATKRTRTNVMENLTPVPKKRHCIHRKKKRKGIVR